MSLTIGYDKGYRKFPLPEQRLFGFGYLALPGLT